jgi:dihydrofolate reductase
MKLSAMLFLSLDGVYQGPGRPREDRRGGFERGGWVAPYGHEEVWRFIVSVYERADALLLGRKTWEIWEAYWPHHDTGDAVSHGINVLPKYVPSTTLKNPTWQKTHVIDSDVEAAIRHRSAAWLESPTRGTPRLEAPLGPIGPQRRRPWPHHACSLLEKARRRSVCKSSEALVTRSNGACECPPALVSTTTLGRL